MTPAPFSKDIREFLMWLSRHGVQYVIVGGEAVIYYGHARLTGDIDIFYDRSPGNCQKLFAALADFWQGSIPGIDSSLDLQGNNLIIQFGLPPHRIDLLSAISAVDFSRAWEGKVTERMKVERVEYTIYYIGLTQLIRNKKAVMRPRDSEDLEFLSRIEEPVK
jgi:predicted nucleotidyltransferase